MNDRLMHLEPAPIIKRLWAAIMDAAVLIMTYFAMAIWVFTPIAIAAFGYGDKNDQGYQYRFASHLTINQKQNDDGQYVIVEVKDSTGKYSDYVSTLLYNYSSEEPLFYINRIYYYYHNYKTNVDIEFPNDGIAHDAIKEFYASPEYNKEINGVLPVNYYTDEWFANEILAMDKTDSYFTLDETKVAFLDKIILKEGADKNAAISYLKGKANSAMADLYYSDYFKALNNEISAIQLFIFIPPFVIGFAIYYFLFPLLFKNGETLGKKVTHLAVVSYEGFTVKKRQVVLRQVLLFAAMFLAAFVFGIGVTSFAILGLMTFILFVATLIPKNKRAPHDFAAYTLVVDSIHSTWFDNLEDEMTHKKQIDDNMAKYKKNSPINQNVIQVGSTIVDEDLKKSVEEENSKKNSQK